MLHRALNTLLSCTTWISFRCKKLGNLVPKKLRNFNKNASIFATFLVKLASLPYKGPSRFFSWEIWIFFPKCFFRFLIPFVVMIIWDASLSYLDFPKTVKDSRSGKYPVWIICALVVSALVLLVAITATWSYCSRNKNQGKIIFYQNRLDLLSNIINRIFNF